MELVFRTIKPADAPLLKEFLELAMEFSGDEREHNMNKYLEDWGKRVDIGFIVLLKQEKKPIGAVWFRQFTEKNPGLAFVDEKTPEMIAAVSPDYRNQGIGRYLITRLVNQARMEGFRALSVAVHKDNPVLGLYERLNFQAEREDGSIKVMRRVL
ncbi:GNAT family N-acetyltransferase [Laceyella putida]|jgi:ribosomal protein S18 acetylase RimI-like enzyme|uniref:GNAT family N-acetyltransferase n=1 Tax=Laceyella putida TaxID=110101 RepID=A0ABW2RJQ1_9BACL